MLWRVFAFDIVSTVVIWILSHIYGNANLYDPYWSVQPVVFWFVYLKFSKSAFTWQLFIISFIPILIWALRLTLNWAYQWRGRKDQDWRYTSIRNFCPLIWPLSNLVAIQLVPTVLVFAGMIPMFNTIENSEKLSNLSIAGSILSILAATLQLFADMQMINFRKDRNGKTVIDIGLWKHSRHPNYLGEILFWTGVWLVDFISNPQYKIGIVGPLTMIFLFNVISIPLMEGRMKNRPGYKEYQQKVSRLLLMP